jgi:hypothetical protein
MALCGERSLNPILSLQLVETLDVFADITIFIYAKKLQKIFKLYIKHIVYVLTPRRNN